MIIQMVHGSPYGNYHLVVVKYTLDIYYHLHQTHSYNHSGDDNWIANIDLIGYF